MSIDEDWELLNPDSAMRTFGPAEDFTAFIWILDKEKNKAFLFTQQGNQYHSDLTERHGIRDIKSKENVTFYDGRFGKVANDKRKFGEIAGKGFIAAWTRDIVSEEDEKTFLRGMLGQSPMEIVGNSPAELPITRDYIFKEGYHIQTVGDILGDVKGQELDPACTGIEINIQGQPNNIPQVLSKLHMVRGPAMDSLKGAFCTQYPALKKSSDIQHCTVQQQQLDDIASALKCGQDDYGSFLKTGRGGWRQGQKSALSPENIGQKAPGPRAFFHPTQRELDKEYDALRFGKKSWENFSFWGWLQNEEQNCKY